MLAVKNLEVHYGRVRAVSRVSLHVDEGEIVALIGANGAGKTTLLSAISGTVKPSSGTVHFLTREITKASPDAIVRRGVSHVPEGRRVFKPLSVEDNLLIGSYARDRGPLKGLWPFSAAGREGKAEVGRDLDFLYAFFPILAERRKQAAGTLSGGEQQMLAMARALMAKPKLLLLDEPSMGLAPKITREIFEHIAHLRAELGLTVLLVEQNARMALRAADRGYVLETGRVLIQGPADELAHNNDVRRAYLGRDAGP